MVDSESTDASLRVSLLLKNIVYGKTDNFAKGQPWRASHTIRKCPAAIYYLQLERCFWMALGLLILYIKAMENRNSVNIALSISQWIPFRLSSAV